MALAEWTCLSVAENFPSTTKNSATQFSALIDHGTGEQLVSIPYRAACYAQHQTSQGASALELDASHLIARKDEGIGADALRTRTGKLLFFDKMNETNDILLVGFDENPAVRT